MLLFSLFGFTTGSSLRPSREDTQLLCFLLEPPGILFFSPLEISFSTPNKSLARRQSAKPPEKTFPSSVEGPHDPILSLAASDCFAATGNGFGRSRLAATRFSLGACARC